MTNCGCAENDRQKLLQRINEVSFAQLDLSLFLDTHPENQEALEDFQKMTNERNRLLDRYAESYGPLTQDLAGDCALESWKWSKQPFPWE